MPLAGRFVLRRHARLDPIQMQIRDLPWTLNQSWSRNGEKNHTDEGMKAHRTSESRLAEIVARHWGTKTTQLTGVRNHRINVAGQARIAV